MSTYREIFEEDDTDLILKLLGQYEKRLRNQINRQVHENEATENIRISRIETKLQHVKNLNSKIIDESL